MKEDGQAELGGAREDRLHGLVVGVPAARHHLHAAQAGVDRALQLVYRAGVQRVDDGEADEAVAMALHEVGQVGVGTAQRVGVLQ